MKVYPIDTPETKKKKKKKKKQRRNNSSDPKSYWATGELDDFLMQTMMLRINVICETPSGRTHPSRAKRAWLW